MASLSNLVVIALGLLVSGELAQGTGERKEAGGRVGRLLEDATSSQFRRLKSATAEEARSLSPDSREYVSDDLLSVGVGRKLPTASQEPAASTTPSATTAAGNPALVAALVGIFVGLPAVALLMAVVSSNRERPAAPANPLGAVSSLCPCLRGGARPASSAGPAGAGAPSTRQIVVTNPVAPHAHARAESPSPKQGGPLTGKAWLEKRKAEKEEVAKRQPALADAEGKGRRRSRSGSGGLNGGTGSRPASPGTKGGGDVADELRLYNHQHSSVKNLMRRTSMGGGAVGAAYEPPPQPKVEVAPSKPGAADAKGKRTIGERGLHGVLKAHADKSLATEVKEVLTNHGVDVVAIETKLAQAKEGLQNQLQPLAAALPGLPVVGQYLRPHHGPIGAQPGRAEDGAGGVTLIDMSRPPLPPPPRSQRIAAASKPNAPPPARDKVLSARMSFGPQSTAHGHGHGGPAAGGASHALPPVPPAPPSEHGGSFASRKSFGEESQASTSSTPGRRDSRDGSAEHSSMPARAAPPTFGSRSSSAGRDVTHALSTSAPQASGTSLGSSLPPPSFLPGTSLPPGSLGAPGLLATGSALDSSLPAALRTPTGSVASSARASIDGNASPSVLPANYPRPPLPGAPPNLPPPPSVDSTDTMVIGLSARLAHLKNAQHAGSRASLLPPPLLPPPSPDRGTPAPGLGVPLPMPSTPTSGPPAAGLPVPFRSATPTRPPVLLQGTPTAAGMPAPPPGPPGSAFKPPASPMATPMLTPLPPPPGPPPPPM